MEGDTCQITNKHFSQLDMHLPARRDIYIYAWFKITHDKY